MLNKAVLSDPGYTPKRRDLPAILEWLLSDDEALAELAERALLNADESVATLAVERLEGANVVQRVRLVRLLGRLAQRALDARIGEVLVRLVHDPEPKVARSAIVSLGKLPATLAKSVGAESALIECLPGCADPERRAVIEALGKIGDEAAFRALSTDSPRNELEKPLFERARLRLQRTQVVLDESDRVFLDVELKQPFTVAVLHRSGLSGIVAEQLGKWGPGVTDGPECRVLSNYSGCLGDLFRARSMLLPALVIDFERPRVESDWARQIATVLSDPAILDALNRLTSTRPRIRLSLPKEGHQRALLWEISEALGRATDRIEVHPKGALWEVELDRERPRLSLVPKRFDDPRYPYRVREISGASHPSIAAALVHVLAPRSTDVIWDPFVGSGLELIECAYQGDYRELIGTDNSVRSLEAASANAQAAKLERFRLFNADARTARFEGLTGIVTNPPLGIRHQRDGRLEPLLMEFLGNARQNLCAGGRLVWLSPLPQKTAERAASLGFEVRRWGPIDVGGLSPELQLFRAPGKPARRRHA